MEVEREEIARILSKVDYNRIRPKVRKLMAKRASDYIVSQLFSITDWLIGKLDEQPRSITCAVEELKALQKEGIDEVGERRNRRQDVEFDIASDCIRRKAKKDGLLNIIFGNVLGITCPDCGTKEVGPKEERSGSVMGVNGTKEYKSMRYYCKNPECSRKTFTITDQERELGARVTKALKTVMLALVFHNTSSLRHAVRKKSMSHTTVLRWVQRASKDLVNWYDLFQPRSSGTVVIDEKWVRLRKKWYYIFMAVDPYSMDLLHINVYPSNDGPTTREFLQELKAYGFNPDKILTDQMGSYKNAIKDVFPETKHIYCLFHAERSARKAVYNVVKNREDKRYEIVVAALHKVFETTNKQSLEQAWEQFKKTVDSEPIFDGLTDKLEYCRDFMLRVITSGQDTPRTSNAVERVIREFDRKYRAMENFSSFPSMQAWVRLWQVYYRLRPFERGRYAAMSPAQVMGYPVENITEYDYMFAGGDTTYAA